MMHSYRHRLSEGTKTSVHVSALTTVIGTAALLLAWHPVLFSMGLTLTIGILAGYVTAMWVVPALYALWVDPRREEAG
jgi:predicted RND superfamily exporter protein